jgi:hypothetical protein
MAVLGTLVVIFLPAQTLLQSGNDDLVNFFQEGILGRPDSLWGRKVHSLHGLFGIKEAFKKNHLI